MGNFIRKLFSKKSACKSRVSDVDQKCEKKLPPTIITTYQESPKSPAKLSSNGECEKSWEKPPVDDPPLFSTLSPEEQVAQKISDTLVKHLLNTDTKPDTVPDGPVPEEPSPFVRDFGHHEVLNAPQKYRPRRSNVRRSSRRGRATSVFVQGSLESPEPNFQPDENHNTENPSSDSELDKLEPAERAKITRSKLSEMFLKRNHLNSFQNDFSKEEGVEEQPSEPSSPTSPVPRSNESSKRNSFEENGITVRPKTSTKQFGNRMLIDELKKRQSKHGNHFESSTTTEIAS